MISAARAAGISLPRARRLRADLRAAGRSASSVKQALSRADRIMAKAIRGAS